MSFSFHLPDIGEGVIEGEVVQWKVAEGDKIALDQPMVEIMTDKATVEIPSPRAGTIAKINFAEGEICPVGDVLVVIAVEGEAAESAPVAAPAPAKTSKAPNGNGHHAPAAVSNVAGVPAVVPEVIDATATRGRVLATPATRRHARAMQIDITKVPGTGRNGRVTTDDLKNWTSGGAPAAAPATSSSMVHVPQQHTPVAIERVGNEERIPFRGMRRRIAENMSRSKFTATHFTYVEEVDCTDLVSLRNRSKERAAERGVKLTYLPFFVKAIVASLKKWPQLNASLDESTNEIVRKHYYHIGLAAQGPHGLVVTVLRNADQLSIFGIANEIQRLADAVQSGTATRDDLTGSTFTISSLGKLGGVMATPIINFPEVGIVGVHKLEQRPAVRDGEIVARWLMNLSISLDHRLVDGWDGAMFLQDVKTLLEDPNLMFMEMI